jgi:phosphohistidine phosphatase SixA
MRRLATLLTLLVWLASPGARADAVTDALRAGGVALLMRHATAPGNFDPEGFRLDDCATQRNLSAEGRAEARRIGAHLKRFGLVPGEVLSSQWCRCRETAVLAFGSAQDWPALNSFVRSQDNASRQTAEVLARIARLRPGQRPLVLVTHQVVVTAVTGVFPQSGEVVVVAPALEGGRPQVRVIGSLRPEAAKQD